PGSAVWHRRRAAPSPPPPPGLEYDASWLCPHLGLLFEQKVHEGFRLGEQCLLATKLLLDLFALAGLRIEQPKMGMVAGRRRVTACADQLQALFQLGNLLLDAAVAFQVGIHL